MNRILFVDDELRVLEGLRRMLHPLRRQWTMEFVPSGREALDRMAAGPFDVLVSDVRMPGMDGCELLQQVMGRFPAAARIVLSGHCHRPAVLKTVGLAHQFLTKPCDSETLKAAVSRACRMRERLRDGRHQQLVSRVQCLPSPRPVYAALLAEMESAHPSVERLGRIVARDAAMTAKLLQTVSSGFFGSPQKCADPAGWTALLGIETLRLLVLSAGVVRSVEPRAPSSRFLDGLAEHSLRVADCAAAIAASEAGDRAGIDLAYLGGLLHDVGLFVLAEHFPERHAEARALSRAEGISICEAEKRGLGTTHAEVGGCLLALWGAPDAISDVALFHHAPSRSPEAGFGPLAAVHVADAVAAAQDLHLPDEAGLVDVEYLSRIRCAERLGRWCEMCQVLKTREAAS